MTDYQPFPISNFRTGFNQSLEPWLLPRDAFPYVKNAHLYRGVVEKIPGFTAFAQFMYGNSIALDGVIDGVNTHFTGTLPHTININNFYAQSAVNIAGNLREFFVQAGTSMSGLIVDLGSSLGGTGTVNMLDGSVVLDFNTPPQPLGGYNTAVYFSYDYVPTIPSGFSDIMGIKQYYGANEIQDIMAFNTRRLGKVILYTAPLPLIRLEYAISEVPHPVQQGGYITTPPFDGTTLVFTGTLGGPLVPNTVKMLLYNTDAVLRTTIVDNGAGGLVGTATDPAADPTASGFIDYITGNFTITFFGFAPAASDVLNTVKGVYGDFFTGDYTNFFSTCNYRDLMFLTNNVDNIMYYDGVSLNYLNTNLTPSTSVIYPISRCLHVEINRERLLLIGVFLNSQLLSSVIYWSRAGFPLDFTNNEFLPPPTSEPIRLYSFINSDMVVRFANSERIFRYTADAFLPFRWDSTNVLWRCDTNYSAINYDSWFSSISKAAIVGSDGVNAQRVDQNIPDFTLNDRGQYEGPVVSISQNSIGQCYGERFDSFKEGWLCFKRSTPDEDPQEISRSNSVLAFNYTTDTYAVYDFPLTCLGFGEQFAFNTWEDNFDLWGDANYTWGTFFEQSNSLVNLGGDRNGFIHKLGTSNSYAISANPAESIPVLFDVLSKNFNPFVDTGDLARLGYIDFFFTSNATTKVRIQVFADDNLYVGPDGSPQGYYQETTLVLNPSDSMSSNPQVKVWKRVYVGAVAREHTIRIYQNIDDITPETIDQPVRMHAMVLWMKPAGRVFN